MKKVLTMKERGSRGGKARARNLTKKQMSAIGKLGGRPNTKKHGTA